MRPYPGWGSLTSFEYANSSNYNSLQVSLRRQFTKSMMFGGAYTWSRNMAYGTPSSYFTGRARTYGPAGMDRRQTLTVNYLYDLPSLSRHFGGKWLAPLVDHWSISGITSFSTGAPFTPGYSTTYSVETTGSSEGARINVVGSPDVPSDQRTFYRNINPAAFAAPTPCTWANRDMACFGNAGVNIMYGPGFSNWDITIGKKIPIGLGEKRMLDFRAEGYNALNHTEFSGYDTGARFDATGNQVNANFGAFNSTRTPRIIAFVLRLQF